MIVRSRAPLRLGIAGGGSDVSPYCDLYGGYVLNATIDMHAYCTIEPLDTEPLATQQVIFTAADRQEHTELPALAHLQFDDVLDLHKAVYNRIVRQFNNNQPLPLHLTTHSDAPAGSGLGSSSTLVVAMVAAYVEWLRLPLGEYEIAKLAYEIERIDVGLSGGRQDTYAATFGGFNFIEFYEQERVIVNPLRIKNWMINELESSLVLYYTQVSRKSADVIDEQIKNIKNHSDDALAATHAIKQGAIDMKEAILKGNTRQMAELLGLAWEAKKRIAKGITSPAIEQAYETAMQAGAYSGKVSGAGGGGFIMFMVYPERKMNVTRALQKLGGQVTRFHFTPHGTQSWTV